MLCNLPVLGWTTQFRIPQQYTILCARFGVNSALHGKVGRLFSGHRMLKVAALGEVVTYVGSSYGI